MVVSVLFCVPSGVVVPVLVSLCVPSGVLLVWRKTCQPSEMPVAYSTDLRTRMIDAWNAKEGTQRQLAERFKVSLSFVKRVLR